MSMTTDVDDDARSILAQLPTSVKQHLSNILYTDYTACSQSVFLNYFKRK